MKKQRRRIESYRGRRGADRRGWILPGLAAVCLILAVCCLILPGVRFSALLFSGAAVLCLIFWLLNRLGESSRAARIVRTVLLILTAAGLAAFFVTEGMILGASGGGSGQPDAVIVLGAGVNGTKPSLVLESRIDAAAAYLKAHPDVPAVLSGGQGDGESVTEAQCMYDALKKRGISADRLILEENSTTTTENLRNSKKLLADRNVRTVAVVTSDFHLFRACRIIAPSVGLSGVFGVPASTSWWWLNANYYAREAFAVWKQAALQL